ncbi:hypothetical protein BC936DRAFT_147959 [Jimgerdemannia flammicorona]|uniref:Uncharacterized protein n=1 Tax=Jimgerdemannia flammicorona TaxID=994334 RepID=A0A433D419_9FUNG|nr:hypothetical protein BC936DRAFT_147959 [Jimgerdemannia flammicorona]
MTDHQQQPDPNRAIFSNPNWLSDEKLRVMGVPDLHKESFRRYVYQQAFGLNTCFDVIGPHTFATEFLPLTADEVEAIVSNFSPVYKKCTDENARQKVRGNVMLSALANRIDARIAILGGGAVFVKLNTRSPKDVMFDDFEEAHVNRVIKSIKDDLVDIRKEQTVALESAASAGTTIDPAVQPHVANVPTPSPTDFALASLNRTMLRLLRLTTGESAVTLLLRSRRVNEDLGRVRQFAQYDSRVLAGPNAAATQQGGDEGESTNSLVASLVLRAWSDTVLCDTQLEHRAFVYKGTMTALTQYDSMTYDVRIARAKDEIPARVLAFWQRELRDRLAVRHESYVVDFLVGENEIKVIELNPFHNGAGGCLFSWTTDRQQLMGETLEYRYVCEPAKAEVFKVFPAVWDRELSRLVKSDGERERKEMGVFGVARKVLGKWF